MGMLHVKDVAGANSIPLDGDGRAYHMGIKAGECGNSILVVAEYSLAEELAKNLGPLKYEGRSNRGYATYTSNDGISIIAVGIGWCMTDFLLHEGRRVTEGPLSMVYLGHAASPTHGLGTVVNIKDAVGALVNYQTWQWEFRSRPIAATLPISCGDVNGRVLSPASWTQPLDVAAAVSAVGAIDTLEPDVYPFFWLANRAVARDIRVAALSVVSSTLAGDVLPLADRRSKLLEVGRSVLNAWKKTD